MTLHLLSPKFLLPLFALNLASVCCAQQSAPSAEGKSPAKDARASSKRKVWTNDDIPSRPSSQATGSQAQDTRPDQTGQSAGSAAPAVPKRNKPPLLSDPKSVEAADKMIAWEDSDLAAQTQYVQQLEDQARQAPPDQQEHLQQLIEEHKRFIDQIRQERQTLVEQRAQLQKKTAVNSGAPQTSPK
jgi:hypothetical protein